ncbi:Major Facilitator Superfamily [Aspergillus sclerotialis]|uniref:Major Facilitator Superfamily n=1 Tax=Aspergillus sclerotialis TaxID=2070753 RepID=A0A3A2ZQQ7_9EURO|nr:Major Facilitator Superfamily [Aspergillus sclerotialis]
MSDTETRVYSSSSSWKTCRSYASTSRNSTSSLRTINIQDQDPKEDEEKGENKTDPKENKPPRGFLSSLVLIKSSPNPKELNIRTKWFLTWVVSLGSLAAPLSSGILYPVLTDISNDLHTSATVVNLSVAFSTLAVAICPLYWSYISEKYGRRMAYILSFIIFTLFNILSAVSVNIAMFITMKLLASGACASLQSVSAGTIADLWDSRERGKAMGIFFFGPMIGPLLAPIIGGALAIKWSWRSTQWFLVIYGFALLLVMTFFLPETSVNLGKKSESNEEQKSPVMKLFTILIAPVKSVKLLRFLPILITVYYTSITFASYYLLNISIQHVFSTPPYSWSPVIVGLTYTPSALGYLLGSVLGGRWTDYIMQRAAHKAGRFDKDGKPILIPEDRIRENALVAGIMYPLALLWWGWTIDKRVFWIAPLIANFFFGFGCMLITNVTMTMLTEFTPKKSSTGVAVTNLLRNSLACVAAVIEEPLANVMGSGWLFTAACLLCLLSGGSLIFMRRNRERWSEKMKTVAAEFD